MKLRSSLILLILCLLSSMYGLAQRAEDSASELLLQAGASLNYPDSALLFLNRTDPTDWPDSLISEFYRLKGSAFFYKGIKDSAIVYFSSSMRMIEDGPCNGQYALVANGMGVALQSAQLFDQAIDYYVKALSCAEERDDQRLKLKLLTNLSILNREVGNMNESDRFVTKAYALAKSTDNQSALATVLNCQGQNHLAKKQFDSAYVAFTQSLVFRDDDDIKGKAIGLNNLGYVAGLRGKNEEALEYYRLAEQLRQEIGDLAGSASLSLNMGNIFLMLGDLESAQQYFENAAIIGDRINDPDINQRYLRSKAELESAKGNIEESKLLLEQYIRNNDSINRYESVEKIASTPYKMALMEAEKKVRSVQKEKLDRESSLKRQRLINLGLTIGIAVIIGILALFLYQLRMLINLRKTLTEERDQAKTSAEHRRQTLNTIAHELRTPMNAVIALTELMEEEKDPKEVAKMTTLLNKSAQRLSNTTNNVLTFSRLEDGSLVLSKHPVNLSELLRELCNMLTPQIRSKGLAVEQEIEDEIIIQSDRSALDITFMNLIGNAIKYTDEGAIYIGLKRVENGVEIQVKDTGVGIPERARPNLFSAFYRAHESRVKREGTGLGLFICKYYVDLLKGSISFESEEEVGTSFTVFLPEQEKLDEAV